MKVYQAIASVMGELSKTGITKDRVQQGFKFRGIDDVLNALSPLLSAHSLVILPRVISRESVERVTGKGSVLFYVTLMVEFDFVSSEDGSKHTVATYGEAMDSSDKATNKAMSAAYKYACLQSFCIPTEGDNDADATTHMPLPISQQPPIELANSLEVQEIRQALLLADKDENAALKYWGLTSMNDMPKDKVKPVLAQLARNTKVITNAAKGVDWSKVNPVMGPEELGFLNNPNRDYQS